MKPGGSDVCRIAAVVGGPDADPAIPTLLQGVQRGIPRL